jgi:hypothetical protein
LCPQIGTEPSDNQYLVVDIGFAAVPIIMIGNCGPFMTLVKQKPSRHLLSFLPLFSVISFLFIQGRSDSEFPQIILISLPHYEN